MNALSAGKSSDACPLCGLSSVKPNWSYGKDIALVECPRCGTFAANRSDVVLERLKDHRLSGLAREHWECYERPLDVNSEKREELLARAPVDNDVAEKSRRLLKALGRKSEHPGFNVRLDDSNDYPLAYCRNEREFYYYLNNLEEQGWLKEDGAGSNSWAGEITAEGWSYLDSMERANLESDKAFVAMWFDEKMKPVFENALKPAIEKGCGYRAIKIDQKEFLGDIVDEIVAEIRESRFVVADVTGHRNGVYFEAGFAMGLDLPVVWTCREDDAKKIHFDASHLNHIVWKTPEELKTRLTNRILATIGPGPLKWKSQESNL